MIGKDTLTTEAEIKEYVEKLEFELSHARLWLGMALLQFPSPHRLTIKAGEQEVLKNYKMEMGEKTDTGEYFIQMHREAAGS